MQSSRPERAASDELLDLASQVEMIAGCRIDLKLRDLVAEGGLPIAMPLNKQRLLAHQCGGEQGWEQIQESELYEPDQPVDAAIDAEPRDVDGPY